MAIACGQPCVEFACNVCFARCSLHETLYPPSLQAGVPGVDAFKQHILGADSKVKAVVFISSKPDNFIAGADIDMIKNTENKADLKDITPEMLDRAGLRELEKKRFVEGIKKLERTHDGAEKGGEEASIPVPPEGRSREEEEGKVS